MIRSLKIRMYKQRYRVASDQYKNKNFAGMWNTTQDQFEVVYSVIRKSWIASGEKAKIFSQCRFPASTKVTSEFSVFREKGIHNLSRTKQQIDPGKRVREA